MTKDIRERLLEAPHSLIAGTTGCGKSVLINGMIYKAMFKPFPEARFILLDPKLLELYRYRMLPQTLLYASEPVEMVQALQYAVKIMFDRYAYLRQVGLKEFKGEHIYIIVDEFADLMSTMKKQADPLLCRLAQLGRAAHIHLVLATQRPTTDIITGMIKDNICNRLALKCATAQASRNVIGKAGAESLPQHGKGYYLSGEFSDAELVDIPMVDDAEIQRVVDIWSCSSSR